MIGHGHRPPALLVLAILIALSWAASMPCVVIFTAVSVTTK